MMGWLVVVARGDTSASSRFFTASLPLRWCLFFFRRAFHRRRLKLDAVYSDFVHTAVTYGRTIISEYFLHEYMKSVK